MIDKRGREISEESRRLMGGTTKFKPIHGMRNTPEYRIWADILNRCRNKKRQAFKTYGGRGIYVCDRWHKFENFISDMGLRPSINYSIDRIDVNGNYEPGNVQWGLKIDQNKNKTTNKRVIFQDELLIASEVARKIGIKPCTLTKRLQYGFPLEKALSPDLLKSDVSMRKRDKNGRFLKC